MKRFALVLCAVCMPPAAAAQSTAAAHAAVTITADDVRHRIGVLAHDSMRGRNTPGPEIELAAEYVAREFRRLGLAPGGDGGASIQRYPIERARLDTAASHVTLSSGARWRFPADVLHLFGGYTRDGAAGPAVVVSGIAADPAALQAAALGGAMVFYLGPLVAGGNPDPQVQRTLLWLRQQNPAALFVVLNPTDGLWQQQAAAAQRATLQVPWQADGAPILAVRERTVGPMLAARGMDPTALRAERAFQVRVLEELSLTVTVAPQIVEQLSGPNTVGMLQGSDPALQREHLVFSAHMDHVGVTGAPDARCRPMGADSICNGADDDASGTAAVIELAEAYAQLQPRPKRSMIFLTVSGEEKGLWGSDYFGAHPPVPIERIVANLNIDMIGRNWTDTLVVIGKEHSDLGATLERVAARHPELGLSAIDDPWPEENFYFRSDHYNFARRGVPILFFFTGTHEDYHRPSDHVEKIDAEKTARIVRLIFYLGLEIANAAERPQWEPGSYAEIVERN